MNATTMPSDVTPMMAQFLSIKSDYQDALLFYRMGDFYELFFDDAIKAADTLGITLTKRGKHQGNDIPMCGVPAHSHENYLHDLIKAGHRVAICEQVEDPAEAKKRGSKSVVKREVVRLVTPGTLSEDTLLNQRAHNFLAAFVEIRGEGGLAWCDMSTGDFYVAAINRQALPSYLARLNPSEIVIAQGGDVADVMMLEEAGCAVTEIARSSFDSRSAEGKLISHYKTSSLDAFGEFSRAEIAAMGGIFDYLQLTQLARRAFLRPPRRENSTNFMRIDQATLRNLEIVAPLNDSHDATLFQAINRTRTVIGSRRLAARIVSPQTDLALLHERFDFIDLLGGFDTRVLGAHLKKIGDIERAYTRLMLERGGPRDLQSLAQGIVAAGELAAVLNTETPPLLARACQALRALFEVGTEFIQDIADEVPLLLRDGGFIRDGRIAALDELRALRENSRQVIAEKQAEYQRISGVNALKIKFNNVLGYFIETPATHAEKMLSQDMAEHFRHRQTTANAVRFTTVELTELETKILSADVDALAIEKQRFQDMVESLREKSTEITALADAIGEIDIALGVAELARDLDWVRPILNTDMSFDIQDGRHPVVEAALARNGERFVANSANLSNDENGRLWLITGPNMAGKSTFLRQNALIVILAQAGIFVPAKAATIGIVDQIFSRVGASDDLARGRSTFMVEMVETAAILNQATAHSLVILDEIGRGTATYDGLAIAWAVLEHLVEVNKSRGLFATHFHELAALEARHDALYAAHIAIREWQGDVVFLHNIASGFAERSYGVDVAKLAGLPSATVNRARDLLRELENQKDTSRVLDDLPLFKNVPDERAAHAAPIKNELLDEIREILPDSLTPREALDLVYKLVEKAKGAN